MNLALHHGPGELVGLQFKKKIQLVGLTRVCPFGLAPINVVNFGK